MIPGLEMYWVECSTCAYEKAEVKKEIGSLLGNFMKRPGRVSSCKCPKCGAKAKKKYMGPAH